MISRRFLKRCFVILSGIFTILVSIFTQFSMNLGSINLNSLPLVLFTHYLYPVLPALAGFILILSWGSEKIVTSCLLMVGSVIVSLGLFATYWPCAHGPPDGLCFIIGLPISALGVFVCLMSSLAIFVSFIGKILVFVKTSLK